MSLQLQDQKLFNIIDQERILHSNMNIYGLLPQFHQHAKDGVSHHFVGEEV